MHTFEEERENILFGKALNALEKVLIAMTKLYISGENKLSIATIDDRGDYGKFIYSIWPQDDLVDVAYVPSGLNKGDAGLGIGSFSIIELTARQVAELTVNLIKTYAKE